MIVLLLLLLLLLLLSSLLLSPAGIQQRLVEVFDEHLVPAHVALDLADPALQLLGGALLVADAAEDFHKAPLAGSEARSLRWRGSRCSRGSQHGTRGDIQGAVRVAEFVKSLRDLCDRSVDQHRDLADLAPETNVGVHRNLVGLRDRLFDSVAETVELEELREVAEIKSRTSAKPPS